MSLVDERKAPRASPQSPEDLAKKIAAHYAKAQPGTKIMSRRERLVEFGGSNEPWALALTILKDEGFLCQKENDTSYYTTGREREEGAPPVEARVRTLSDVVIVEALEFRMCIEAGASALAARVYVRKDRRGRRSSQGLLTPELDALSAALDETFDRLMAVTDKVIARLKAEETLEEGDQDVTALVRADQDYHGAIHGLVDNTLFRRILSRMRRTIMRNVEKVVTGLYSDLEYVTETKSQHQDMMDAIRWNEEAKARDTTAFHLAFANKKIIASFSARRF